MPPPTFTAWVSVVTVGVLLRIAPLVLGWGGYLSKRSVVCVCALLRIKSISAFLSPPSPGTYQSGLLNRPLTEENRESDIFKLARRNAVFRVVAPFLNPLLLTSPPPKGLSLPPQSLRHMARKSAWLCCSKGSRHTLVPYARNLLQQCTSWQPLKNTFPPRHHHRPSPRLQWCCWFAM